MSPAAAPTSNTFSERPHRTLIGLALPVLGSLVAEPITGLVDTAFVARLGAVPLAALGVGTMVLSGTFWIFNFLGIGTQTAVAQAEGRGARHRAADLNTLAVVLATACGLLLLLAGWPSASGVAAAMGAEGAVRETATAYLRIRLLGAPAVLISVAAFGTLRGLQDMRMPLFVAAGVNLLNLGLDPLMIFGLGPFPALGVAGAAWASVAAQWTGAGWVLATVYRRLPPTQRPGLEGAVALLRVGRDLFFRTAALTFFLLLATRAATRLGAEAGAAHQAVRQVWTTSALFLDAFAVAGQSLVAFFLGGGRALEARRVAVVVCQWSLATGAALGLAMLAATGWAVALLVPPGARQLFGPAWIAAAASQPISGLTFGTDGIHWGTGDYRYLRDAVVVATLLGAAALALLGTNHGLVGIWMVTAGWIGVRAAFGLLRIWPGVGRAPLRSSAGG